MIDGQDLMPNNWILGPDAKPHQVKHLEEALYVEGTEAKERWMVNGDPEELFSPIPLTLELMRTIGWRVHKWDVRNFAGMDPIPEQGAEGAYIEGNDAHPLVVINFVISDGWGQWKKGDIMIFDELITTLHELQQLYRKKMGKPLEVAL